MAKKSTAAKKAAPKVTENQVKEALEMIKGEPAKMVPKPKAKATPAGAKKSGKSGTPSPKAKAKPDYIKDSITEYVVGTDDYRKLIEDHNEKYGTAYNTWRVRPQVLYVIWQSLKDYYGIK
jgi:hypothetical protein